MAEMLRDWSNIPADILMHIAESIHSIEDYVRFGAVCHSWNSAATSLKSDGNGLCHNLKFSPLLMLAEKKDSDLRGFYSFSSNKVFEIDLPEIRGRRCWGSPFGWLVTAGVDMEIHLFNPLTRARISLPPMHTFADQYDHFVPPEDLRTIFIHKAVLSSSPSSSDCIVMAINSECGKLGFAKVGDHVWSPIDIRTKKCPVQDVTYFNGDFFVAKSSGELLICDLSTPHPEAVLFAEPPWGLSELPPIELVASQKYLVDLGGELCMVFRSYYDYDAELEHSCYFFEIYKLDMRTKKWEQIKSLGDSSFFVGTNYSFCIRGFDYPGFKSNCIHFTDDFFPCYEDYGGLDAGMYNMDEDEDDDMYHPLPTPHDLFSTFCPPLWIKPQF